MDYRRVCIALAVLATTSSGCVTPDEPRLQTGPNAIVTPDGLHRVDGVSFGTLFMKRNYAFGSYEKFVLGETQVIVEPGAKPLDDEEVEDVKARFNDVAREVIVGTGRTEVSEPGPCVATVELSLVDLDLVPPSPVVGAGTSMVSSYGAVTLVLEIRDGHTDEALLRYGRRRLLEGGTGTRSDSAKGAPLTAAIERFAVDFRDDFTNSLPRLAPTTPLLTCEQRAGLAPITPRADAERETRQTLRLTPNRERGRLTYASCAGCHKPSAAGRSKGSIPQLAGQHRKVVIKQLADIRSGNRDNATMYAFTEESRMGGAQAIADVADYLAALEVSVDTQKGPGDALALGEDLYEPNCSRCHGPNGEGDGDRYIPRIQAQHYSYLTRQFQQIKDGQRHNADPEMRAQIQDLSAQESAAILDYVSRLSPR